MKILLIIFGILATLGTSALIMGLIALAIKKKSQISWSWSWLIWLLIGISLIVSLKFISFSGNGNGVDPPPPPTSGIFIIPPDGVLVDRDTTGERVVYHNIGDKIVIDVVGSIIPEATYFVNAGKTPSVKITKRRTILTVIGLLKNYVRFKNFGTETARVRVIIIPRKKYR